ncbi:hypothetical protein ACQKNX_22760 [Lysinibacillus sp. NPDC093712]|uniref:hypothetical protein n=1 Tax=Lysinibacillus sp. NPDC093712 TaxID=3390579 RepID=UPI003D07E690
MTDIISFMVSIIDYLGTTKSIIILIISFFLLLLLMYISVLAEHSSLLDILHYRTFIVIATKPEGEVIKVELKAWGRINAVEKAAKKIGYTNGEQFTVTEIKN